MKFLDPFWKASFYTDSKAVSFWKAYGRIVLVTFLVSLVYAVFFYILFGKDIPSYMASYGQQAIDGYPSELILTIKDGELSKNIPGEIQLYPIIDGQLTTATSSENNPKYVLTINDATSVSLASLKDSDSYALLAKDGWIAQGDNETRANSYGELLGGTKDFTFNRDMLVSGVNTILSYAGSIPWIIIAIIVIFYTFGMSLFYLLVTLFTALMLMLLSEWIIRRKVRYGEAYVLSLYALAPVIIINELLLHIPYVLVIVGYIPLLTTVSVLIFIWYMFRKHERSPETI